MFDRSVYILLGLGVAAVYGVGATILYGPDNLMSRAWVEAGFWALAASGIVLLVILDVYDWLQRIGHRFSRFYRGHVLKKSSTTDI